MATVQVREFKDALSKVMAVVPAKPSMDILESVLVKFTEDGALVLTGTNLDATVVMEIVADSDTTGALAIPGKRLSALLKTLPSHGNVHIEFARNVATLTSGGLAVNIEGKPEEEFPEFRLRTDTISVVQAEHLYAIRMQVLHAVASDASRPVLACVNLCTGVRLEATAADGFRLAQTTFASGYEGDLNILIQPVVLKLFGKQDRGDVLIGSSDRMVHFEYNQLRSRMIVATLNSSGTFPDFRRLLPNNVDTMAEVLDIDLLKQAVKAAAQTAVRREIAVVTLEFGDDTLLIMSSAATTAVSARTVGHAMTKLDAKLLLDAINACDDTLHIMIQHGVARPVILTNARSAAAYPDFDAVQLIMPVVERY